LQLYEVQKYITLDGHIWSENIMVMNPDRFYGLPDAARQIVLQAAKRGRKNDLRH
jgi:TRAP-type C4-dicarboxylate transport system substrate-binding protein